MTCRWFVMREDYTTREQRGPNETLRKGRDGHVRLEAATGRKEARRRRWSGVEEKGSGREREVVAIAAAATESMGGDGERTTARRRCSWREIF